MIKKILAFSLIVLFISCERPPDLSDYYFPIEEIEEFVVYEYSNKTTFQGNTRTSVNYFKLYNLDEKVFSLVFYSEELEPGLDSSIFKKSDNGIYLLSKYHKLEKNHEKSSDQPQLFFSFYPQSDSPTVTTISYETHTEMHTSQFVDLEDEKATFLNITVGSSSAEEHLNQETEAILVYKKNIGLIEMHLNLEVLQQELRFNRTYTPQQWKKKTAANNG